MTDLYNQLIRSATVGLELQRDDGSLPAGHNGPYNHTDTPVRNTSHWLQTFAWAYEQTNNTEYLHGVEKATSYLLSQPARPAGITFHHRSTPSKNKCNSLIGQAWSIEALCRAAEVLDDRRPLDTAAEVFFHHQYDFRFDLWHMREIDGSDLGICRTFNQQLWFAAVGSLLDKQGWDRAGVRTRRFLNRLHKHMSLTSKGQIEHLLYSKIQFSDLPWLINKKRSGVILNYILRPFRSNTSQDHIQEQSVGYHSFNLYALALLKQRYPSHSIWDRSLIDDVLNYTSTNQYQNQLQTNKFAYQYNPTGFEVAFALETFRPEMSSKIDWWIENQIEKCYNKNTGLMDRGVDPETLSARIYQATRLTTATN